MGHTAPPAHQPLRHAERLALWHQPIRIRRSRRRWWPRVALLCVVVALAGFAATALPPAPQAIVIGRVP